MDKSLTCFCAFWVIVITAMLFFACTNASAQTSYKMEGNTYVQVKDSSKTAYQPVATEYYYQGQSDNQKYQIYVGKTGSCFIKKISKKTGNEYRQYLGETISKDICSKIGITYQPKKK
jgi:hypothetical protein